MKSSAKFFKRVLSTILAGEGILGSVLTATAQEVPAHKTIATRNADDILGFSTTDGVPTIDVVLEQTVEWDSENTYIVKTLIEHKPVSATNRTNYTKTVSHKYEHTEVSTTGKDEIFATATISAKYTYDKDQYIAYSNASGNVTLSATTVGSVTKTPIKTSNWGGSWFNKPSIKVYYDYTIKNWIGSTTNHSIWVNCDADGNYNQGR